MKGSSKSTGKPPKPQGPAGASVDSRATVEYCRLLVFCYRCRAFRAPSSPRLSPPIGGGAELRLKGRLSASKDANRNSTHCHASSALWLKGRFVFMATLLCETVTATSMSELIAARDAARIGDMVEVRL